MNIFTEEQLSKINKAVEEVKSGKSLTMNEVREHFGSLLRLNSDCVDRWLDDGGK